MSTSSDTISTSGDDGDSTKTLQQCSNPGCDKTSRFICSKCKKTSYCDYQCSTQHWTDHRPICKMYRAEAVAAAAAAAAASIINSGGSADCDTASTTVNTALTATVNTSGPSTLPPHPPIACLLNSATVSATTNATNITAAANPAASNTNKVDNFWRNALFAGTFLDPYIEGPIGNKLFAGTDRTIQALDFLLEVLQHMLNNQDKFSYFFKLDGSVSSNACGNAIQKMRERFTTSKLLSVKLDQARQYMTHENNMPPERVVDLIDYTLDKITSLRNGEVLIIPGGWIPEKSSGHAVAYVVECIQEKESFAWVTCNTGEGLQYHFSCNSDYPRVKYKTAMRIDGIPFQKLTCPDFWFMLYSLQFTKTDKNNPKNYYESLLPHLLVQKTDIVENMKRNFEASGDFKNPQKAGTCTSRSLLTALKYCLKYDGLTGLQRKLFSVAFRSSLISLVSTELSGSDIVDFNDSDAYSIRLACRQVMMSYLKFDKIVDGNCDASQDSIFQQLNSEVNQSTWRDAKKSMESLCSEMSMRVDVLLEEKVRDDRSRSELEQDTSRNYVISSEDISNTLCVQNRADSDPEFEKISVFKGLQCNNLTEAAQLPSGHSNEMASSNADIASPNANMALNFMLPELIAQSRDNVSSILEDVFESCAKNCQSIANMSDDTSCPYKVRSLIEDVILKITNSTNLLSSYNSESADGDLSYECYLGRDFSLQSKINTLSSLYYIFIYYVGVSLILDKSDDATELSSNQLVKRPETDVTLLCIHVLYEIIFRHTCSDGQDSHDAKLTRILSRYNASVNESMFDQLDNFAIRDPRFVLAREKAISCLRRLNHASLPQFFCYRIGHLQSHHFTTISVDLKPSNENVGGMIPGFHEFMAKAAIHCKNLEEEFAYFRSECKDVPHLALYRNMSILMDILSLDVIRLSTKPNKFKILNALRLKQLTNVDPTNKSHQWKCPNCSFIHHNEMLYWKLCQKCKNYIVPGPSYDPYDGWKNIEPHDEVVLSKDYMKYKDGETGPLEPGDRAVAVKVENIFDSTNRRIIVVETSSGAYAYLWGSIVKANAPKEEMATPNLGIDFKISFLSHEDSTFSSLLVLFDHKVLHNDDMRNLSQGLYFDGGKIDSDIRSLVESGLLSDDFDTPGQELETFNPQEAVQFRSFLDVPQVAPVLALNFIAADRVKGLLPRKKFQTALDYILFRPGISIDDQRMIMKFEDGNWLNQCQIPCKNEKMLSAEYGILFDDMKYSPEIILQPMIKICRDIVGSIGKCDFTSYYFDAFLYVIRLTISVIKFCLIRDKIADEVPLEDSKHLVVLQQLYQLLFRDIFDRLKNWLKVRSGESFEEELSVLITLNSYVSSIAGLAIQCDYRNSSGKSFYRDFLASSFFVTVWQCYYDITDGSDKYLRLSLVSNVYDNFIALRRNIKDYLDEIAPAEVAKLIHEIVSKTKLISNEILERIHEGTGWERIVVEEAASTSTEETREALKSEEPQLPSAAGGGKTRVTSDKSSAEVRGKINSGFGMYRCCIDTVLSGSSGSSALNSPPPPTSKQTISINLLSGDLKLTGMTKIRIPSAVSDHQDVKRIFKVMKLRIPLFCDVRKPSNSYILNSNNFEYTVTQYKKGKGLQYRSVAVMRSHQANDSMRLHPDLFEDLTAGLGRNDSDLVIKRKAISRPLSCSSDFLTRLGLNEDDVEEEYIPIEFLDGILPGCLLEDHLFWRTSEHTVRGDAEDLSSSLLIDLRFNHVYLLDIKEESPRRLINLLELHQSDPLCTLKHEMNRIEDLSHVLVWAKADASLSFGREGSELDVNLPRLKLSFKSCVRDGRTLFLFTSHKDEPCIYSDNADSKSRQEIDKLFGNFKNFIVLANDVGQFYVLMPNYKVSKKLTANLPFFVDLTFSKSSIEWSNNVDSRYFIYLIHPTLSYLEMPSLSAALYWILILFLHHKYEDAANLITTVCQTDVPLSKEQNWIVEQIPKTATPNPELYDMHPDAHACRLLLNVLLLESDMKLSSLPLELNKSEDDDIQNINLFWKLSSRELILEDLSAYYSKFAQVSRGCKLTLYEESALLKNLGLSRHSNELRRQYEVKFEVAINDGNFSILSDKPVLHLEASGAFFDWKRCKHNWEFSWENKMRDLMDKPVKCKRLPSNATCIPSVQFLQNIISDDLKDRDKKYAYDEDTFFYKSGESLGFVLLYELIIGAKLQLSTKREYCCPNNVVLAKLLLEKYSKVLETAQVGSSKFDIIKLVLSRICDNVAQNSSQTSKAIMPVASTTSDECSTGPDRKHTIKDSILFQCRKCFMQGPSIETGTEKCFSCNICINCIKSIKFTKSFFENLLANCGDEDLINSNKTHKSKVSSKSGDSNAARSEGHQSLSSRTSATSSDSNCCKYKGCQKESDSAYDGYCGGHFLSTRCKYVDSSAPKKKECLRECIDIYDGYCAEHYIDSSSSSSSSGAAGGGGQPTPGNATAIIEEDEETDADIFITALDISLRDVLRSNIDKYKECFSSRPQLSDCSLSEVSIKLADVRSAVTPFNDLLNKNICRKLFEFKWQIDKGKINSVGVVSNILGLLQSRASSMTPRSFSLENSDKIASLDSEDSPYPASAFSPMSSAENSKGSEYDDSGAPVVFSKDDIEELMREIKILLVANLDDSIKGVRVVEDIVNGIDKASIDKLNVPQDDLMKSKYFFGEFSKIDFNFLLSSLASTKQREDLGRRNPFIKHLMKSQDDIIVLNSRVVEVVLKFQRYRHLIRCYSLCSTIMNIFAIQTDIIKNKEECFKVKSAIEDLVSELKLRRHYMETDETNGSCKFDPRFLIFEYLSGFLLRNRQVELVNSFIKDRSSNKSRIEQMIMGQGKTTVIAPLLAMMMADGESLVTLVCPDALIQQSRLQLKQKFSYVLFKSIWTLNFDRSSNSCNDLGYLKTLSLKLNRTRKNKALVLATPEAVKSIFLKFIEMKLPSVESVSMRYDQNLNKNELHKIIKMWGSGVAILDEVDLLLHPLKSELNFPIFSELRLPYLPFRYDLPMFLLGVFVNYEANSTLGGGDKSTVGIYSKLKEGVDNNAFMKDPHLVLLSDDWYRVNLLLPIAELVTDWMVQQESIIQGTTEIKGFPILTLYGYILDFILAQDDNMLASEDAKSFTKLLCENELSECEMSKPKAVTENITFKVGDKVGLTEDFARYNDASYGILKPKDKGTVIAVSGDFVSVQKNSNGKAWNYNRKALGKYFEKTVDPFSDLYRRGYGMLVIAREWVQTILPYCLSKRYRVNYGLIRSVDERRWKDEEVEKSGGDESARNNVVISKSRRLLAVPFVGKDVPSQSAEFADPEVAIGLSVLAYMYEGMREGDATDLVRLMVKSMLEDSGIPYAQRPARKLFERWKEATLTARQALLEDKYGKVIAKDQVTNANLASDLKLQEENKLIHLELIRLSDPKDLTKVWRLLHKNEEVIKYYLSRHVFDKVLKQNENKLQSNGVDLGGDMLFGIRFGFTGTMSQNSGNESTNGINTDLGTVTAPFVPLELASNCYDEKGSLDKVMRTLSNPKVVHCPKFNLSKDWAAESLLQLIMQDECNYGAFIDVGALITGLSAEEVARYIINLQKKMKAKNKDAANIKEAVVFIDDRGFKKVMDWTYEIHDVDWGGVPVEKRFVFYDHIHTTGIDIKHSSSAVALCTLGKDTTLRDFSQGCWRMRGIGDGQKIHVVLVPEILKIIEDSVKMEDKLGAAAAAAAAAGDSTGTSSVSLGGYTYIIPAKPIQRPSIQEQIIAWLRKNGDRSEKQQYTQLKRQIISNIWRKQAFHSIFDPVAHGNVKLEVFIESLLVPFKSGTRKKCFEDLSLLFDKLKEGKCLQNVKGIDNTNYQIELNMAEEWLTSRVDLDSSDERTDTFGYEIVKEMEQEQELQIEQEKHVYVVRQKEIRDEDNSFFPLSAISPKEGSSGEIIAGDIFTINAQKKQVIDFRLLSSIRLDYMRKVFTLPFPDNLFVSSRYLTYEDQYESYLNSLPDAADDALVVIDNSDNSTFPVGDIGIDIGENNLGKKVSPECSIPRCPKGHELLSKVDSSEWTCDGKSERHDCIAEYINKEYSGKMRWSCSVCEFNYCNPCFEKRKNYSKVSVNSEGLKTFLIYDDYSDIYGSQPPMSMRHCCSKVDCLNKQCESCFGIDKYLDPFNFRPVKSVYRILSDCRVREGPIMSSKELRKITTKGELVPAVGIGSIMWLGFEVFRVKLKYGGWASIKSADVLKPTEILELVGSESDLFSLSPLILNGRWYCPLCFTACSGTRCENKSGNENCEASYFTIDRFSSDELLLEVVVKFVKLAKNCLDVTLSSSTEEEKIVERMKLKERGLLLMQGADLLRVNKEGHFLHLLDRILVRLISGETEFPWRILYNSLDGGRSMSSYAIFINALRKMVSLHSEYEGIVEVGKPSSDEGFILGNAVFNTFSQTYTHNLGDLLNRKGNGREFDIICRLIAYKIDDKRYWERFGLGLVDYSRHRKTMIENHESHGFKIKTAINLLNLGVRDMHTLCQDVPSNDYGSRCVIEAMLNRVKQLELSSEPSGKYDFKTLSEVDIANVSRAGTSSSTSTTTGAEIAARSAHTPEPPVKKFEDVNAILEVKYQSGEGGSRFVIISLAEANTLKHLLQYDTKLSLRRMVGLHLIYPMNQPNCLFPIVDSEEFNASFSYDFSELSPMTPSLAISNSLRPREISCAVQCARLFNAEFFFDTKSLHNLLDTFQTCPKQRRENFFKLLLSKFRPRDNIQYDNAQVKYLFKFKNAEVFQHLIDDHLTIRSVFKMTCVSAKEAFSKMKRDDASNPDSISAEELSDGLASFLLQLKAKQPGLHLSRFEGIDLERIKLLMLKSNDLLLHNYRYDSGNGNVRGQISDSADRIFSRYFDIRLSRESFFALFPISQEEKNHSRLDLKD